MKSIGSNFSNEIAAAGLSGLPFSWDENGLFFPLGDDGEEMISAADKNAVLSVYDAHDPDQPDVLSAIEELESQITPRRMREAVLGTDDGWLAAKDAEIQALREQL